MDAASPRRGVSDTMLDMIQSLSLADLYDLTWDMEAALDAGESENIVGLLAALETEIQRRWGVDLGECH